MVLKDFSNLLETIQNNKNLISDFVNIQNDKYAYNVKEPSYHNDTNCQWMNKSFHNIEIPNNKTMVTNAVVMNLRCRPILSMSANALSTLFVKVLLFEFISA